MLFSQHHEAPPHLHFLATGKDEGSSKIMVLKLNYGQY